MSKLKMATACFVSGTCFSASTLMVQMLPSVNPLLLVAARSSLLSVITIPVCLLRRHSPTVEPEEKISLLIHLLTGSAFLMCFFYAVRFLSLADATTIAASAPVFANLLSCLLKKRCSEGSTSVVVAALVASAGVLFVTRLDLTSLGVCLALAGTASQSVFLLRPLRKTHVVAVTLIQSLFTTAVSTILFTFVQDMGLPPCGAGGVYFLFCGLLASAGQYVCFIGSPPPPPLKTDEEILPFRYLSDLLMAFVLQSTLLQERSPLWSSCIGATLVALCLIVPSIRRWHQGHQSRDNST